MKRIAIIGAVICLLAASQVSQAVNLDGGWYAKFGGVVLTGLDESHPDPMQYADQWWATSPLGRAGPLLVEEGGSLYPRGRAISVPEDTSVAAGVLFQDRGDYDRSYPCYEWVSF